MDNERPLMPKALLEKKLGGCCGGSARNTAEERERLARLAEEFRQVVQNGALNVREAPPSTETLRAGTAHIDPPVAVGAVVEAGVECLEVSSDACIPLAKGLSHHSVSGMHLWIAVSEAGVVVLDDNEHEIMLQMQRECPPKQVFVDGCVTGSQDALRRVSKLVGKLAAGGFVNGIRGYVEAKRGAPSRFARFHLTKACQLECIHCYSESSPRVDRTGELPTERWIALVKEYAEQGGEKILFTGGEALFHKGCCAILTAAKQAGLHVSLFSNGLWIPKHIDVIAKYVDEVQVSLDGVDAESNDPIRGKGTYAKVMEAVDLLLAHRIQTRIGMTAMRANWDAFRRGFFDFAARFANKPIEYRVSFDVMQYGRGETIVDELDVSETRALAESFMSTSSSISRGPRVTRVTRGCGYCEQLVIGPDGTVYPCHLLDAKICHVDDMPLAHITRLVESMARFVDVDQVEGCSTCDIRYLCGGTCRVIDSKKTGSRFITTCTEAEKNRKLTNLVDLYRDKTTTCQP